MKKLSVLIILILGLQNIYAQIDSYDLSKYVQGDVSLSNSYISPSFNFSSYSSESNNNNQTLDRGNARAYYQYNKYINTQNKYVEYSIGGSFSGSGERQNQIKALRLTPLIDLEYLTNIYFSKNQFIGFSIDTRNYMEYYKYYGAINSTSFVDKTYDTNTVVELSYGIGRAQIIEDPLKAIAIFKALEKNNFLLKGLVSHEDIDELSTLLNDIRSLRNKDLRYVDSRLLNIAKFNLLSEHLIENKIVRADNYAMFGLLYDTYRFENYYFRRTNNELRIGASYEYDRRINNRVSRLLELDYVNNVPSLFVRYELNKPLGIMWFLSGETEVNYEINDIHRTETNDNEVEVFNQMIDRISMSTEWLINYQPNVRTRFNAGFDLLWIQSKIEEGLDPEIKEKINGIGFNVGLDYYFSPQYFMSMDLGMDSYDKITTESFRKQITTSMSLSINYIFI